MGSRVPSHQLKSGLVVSGPPEQPHKEKMPTMASRAVPYTGGDVKKSGELGKMFDIPYRSPSASSSNNNSGSGPVKRKSGSGPIPLQPTGLITSGPLSSSSSGPLHSAGGGGGAVETATSTKAAYGPAVTSIGSEEVKVGFGVSRAVVWVVMVVTAMGLVVGAFLMVAIKKPVILVAIGGLVVGLAMWVIWNCFMSRRALLGFISKYPDTELRGAFDGQYVKVTGVVTCGSIPLESSYQRVPRCVYVSTELYEYRGLGGTSAHPRHHFFSWGSRYSEKYVADFYVSDFQSGLRALVKAGYGAKVAPFVKPATVVDITKTNKEMSPSFLRWLADRSLSSDNRIMRLKEGYIKEGSTVSVMGVVRRHDNVLMIVPPQQPISTGCQWCQCLLPIYAEGVVITCDENQNADVIAQMIESCSTGKIRSSSLERLIKQYNGKKAEARRTSISIIYASINRKDRIEFVCVIVY